MWQNRAVRRTRRSARLGTVVVVAFVLLIASTTRDASAGAAVKPLSLSQRLLRPNELPGFVQSGDLQERIDPGAWAKIAPASLTDLERRLRQGGFVAAVREDLKATATDRGALSIVVQFASARAAGTELMRQLHDYSTESQRTPGERTTLFAVHGIPGAHGYTAKNAQSVGVNVIFSDGPFAYHVGAGWSASATKPPTRAAVVAAATRLYERVRGRPSRP